MTAINYKLAPLDVDCLIISLHKIGFVIPKENEKTERGKACWALAQLQRLHFQFSRKPAERNLWASLKEYLKEVK